MNEDSYQDELNEALFRHSDVVITLTPGGPAQMRNGVKMQPVVLEVAKNRCGPTGKSNVVYLPEYACFEEPGDEAAARP